MEMIVAAAFVAILSGVLIMYMIKEDAPELLPAIIVLLFILVTLFVFGLKDFRNKGIEQYQKSEIVTKQPVYIYTDINGDTLKVEEGTKVLISKKRLNIQ